MTTENLPNAHLLKRLTAIVYDSLIVMAIAMGYGAVFLAIKHTAMGIELAPDERATMGTPGFVGLILVLEIFFWFFWCRGGQTLGMRAWRLQIIQDDGRAPNLLQALIRGLVGPFSLILFGAGYWWSLIDNDGLTWHDRASRTRTIERPKK